MSSIGIKLPITVDGSERIMEPNFGVGLHELLFSGYHEGVEARIKDRVEEQVSIYMPAVKISAVDFSQSRDFNALGVIIKYSIPALGVNDSLQVAI